MRGTDHYGGGGMGVIAIAAAIVLILLLASCTNARAYHPNAKPTFGTYSQKYLDKQERKRVNCAKVKRCRGGRDLCRGGSWQAESCSAPVHRMLRVRPWFAAKIRQYTTALFDPLQSLEQRHVGEPETKPDDVCYALAEDHDRLVSPSRGNAAKAPISMRFSGCGAEPFGSRAVALSLQVQLAFEEGLQRG
jgi:hypothetical protein